jgi:hypothetical protein
MGFAGMRRFGLDLIHRTQLKVRSDLQYNNFMLVDSPGMIDSPGMLQARHSTDLDGTVVLSHFYCKK